MIRRRLSSARHWCARLLLLAAMLVPCLPGTARAHAQLLGSTPPDGAILPAAPDRIVLRFGEAVRPIIARLTSPDEGTVVLPEPKAAGEQPGEVIEWPLPPLAAEGSYLLSWRVTSADGHPLAGGLLFSVGHATDLRPEENAATLATRAILWLARTGMLAGLLIGAGGAGFTLVSRRSAPSLTRRAAWTGLIALPLVALFQGLELLAAGPAAILTPAPWQEALVGPPALALALAGIALIAALCAGNRRWLAALSLLAVAAAAASSGHAATAPPQILMRPAIALHVLAATVWIGALAPLAACLAKGNGGPALRRFSALIPAVLALLIATGIALATVQLGRVQALWETGYGRVLLAKLGLLAGLLALALWNRLRLTPLAQAGQPRPLIRAIRTEILLALLIIATLSLWRFTPPPRSLAAPSAAIVQTIRGDHVSARITLASDRPGPNHVTLDDLRLDGAPFVPQETTVEFSKPAYGLGPFTRTLPQDTLDAGTFLLPIDGFWVLRLTFLIDDFRSEQILDIITIGK